MNDTQVLRDLLRRSEELLGLPSPDRRPEVDRRIGLLAERESAIQEYALVVVLLGGTKVGKTTLVNALAGKVIGEVSAKACFTARPTVYVHRTREGLARARLAGVLSGDDRVEIHDEESLEGIILVDTPDFDGIEAVHQVIFHQVLERADLALCVVTTQKYDDRELFQVLGRFMGFRRTVVVFNRTDEGIPLSPAIREDFSRKFAQFQLKPPEGGALPIFSISALNALLRKLGQGRPPTGEFAGLEALLKERLDGELIRKISEENFSVFREEIVRFTAGECGLEQACELVPQLRGDAERAVQLLEERGREITESILESVVEELLRRRAKRAAEGLGGPFGAWMRLSLAIRGLSSGWAFVSMAPAADEASGLTDRLIAVHQPVFAETRETFRRQILETADRVGLGEISLGRDLEGGFPTGRITGEIRKCLAAPVGSVPRTVLYNAAPVAIILLLFRYFVVALMTLREPSAGMFIGGGLVFGLICSLQGIFWLRSVSGDPATLHREIRAVFLEEARRLFQAPVDRWSLACEKLREDFRRPGN
jgi:GTP-binding protein EngB required for normal cell division